GGLLHVPEGRVRFPLPRAPRAARAHVRGTAPSPHRPPGACRGARALSRSRHAARGRVGVPAPGRGAPLDRTPPGALTTPPMPDSASSPRIEDLRPVSAGERVFTLPSYVLMLWASLIVVQAFVLGQALLPPQGTLTLLQGF